MNQYDFDTLLQKYLAGACNQAEEKRIREWSDNMLKHSDHQIGDKEKELINKRLRKRLSIVDRPVFSLKNHWFMSGIAALLIMAVSFAFLFRTTALQKKNISSVNNVRARLPSTTGNIETKNTSAKPYEVTLSDASKVVLQPGSSLSYPENFDEKLRKVYLEGEAFFNVTKNPNKPFIVYTGDLVTQVLGTSFIVKSYDISKAIEVEVISGRVSVYENSQKSPQARNGIILIPNQKIIFNKESKTLIPELVTEPIIVHDLETKSQFIFEETLLPQVLSRIEKAYGIEIVIENTALNTCEFTGNINDFPLYSQLKLICRAVNANYELRGTTFFLNGEGCSN